MCGAIKDNEPEREKYPGIPLGLSIPLVPGLAMISLSLSGLVLFYLAAFLSVITLVWTAHELVRKGRERRARRYRLQCAICGMAYEDRSTTALPRCPRCGSLNERLKVKAY